MKRLLLLLAASALTASPAAAQHAGHTMPGHTMPAKKPAAKKPAPKKPATKKPVAKKPAVKKAPAKKAAPKAAAKPKPAAQQPDAHAGHQMPAEQEVDPHAGHQVPAAEQPAPDPHAGHQMPGQAPAADPHAGHGMAAAPIEVPVGPPPPEALTGPDNAADAVWGTGAMQGSRAFLLTKEHGGMASAKLLIDQAEARFRSGRNGYFLNAEGWYGGDIDKLWLKTEIEGDFGHKPEQAEFQALWGRAVDPWINLQAGIRLDAQPKKRARLVLGAEGLAPYWIEFDVAAFLSDKGDVTARAEVEHDVRITQKLVLQPRAELDFSLQNIPNERVGAGLSTAELGLRLRYQFVPNFAPYVGVNYGRAFGETRDFIRAEGDDPSDLSFVVGVRAFF